MGREERGWRTQHPSREAGAVRSGASSREGQYGGGAIHENIEEIINAPVP